MSHPRMILKRLMETPGAAVTDAELRKAGWPDREDVTLHRTIVGSAVYLLRIAGHKIETVKGVGYIWHKGPEPRPAAVEEETEGVGRSSTRTGPRRRCLGGLQGVRPLRSRTRRATPC